MPLSLLQFMSGFRSQSTLSFDPYVKLEVAPHKHVAMPLSLLHRMLSPDSQHLQSYLPLAITRNQSCILGSHGIAHLRQSSSCTRSLDTRSYPKLTAHCTQRELQALLTSNSVHWRQRLGNLISHRTIRTSQKRENRQQRLPEDLHTITEKQNHSRFWYSTTSRLHTTKGHIQSDRLPCGVTNHTDAPA